MSDSHSDGKGELNLTNAQSSTRRQTLALLGSLGGLGLASSQTAAAHDENTDESNSGDEDRDDTNNDGSGPNVDPDTEFSIAIFPDTQYYTEQDNGIFEQMAQWVADHKEEYNIEMFLHEGDIVQNYGSDNDNEWDIAQDAIRRIDDENIPTVLSLGNHDADEIRDPQTFRSRFPESRYKEIAQSNETIIGWGTFEGGSENAYLLQELHGRKFLFMTLEFGPRSAALEWGREVTLDHPEATTFLVTHLYLDNDGQWAGDGAVSSYIDMPEFAEENYMIAGSEYNNGRQMWEGELRFWENLANVHSGHFVGEVTGDFVDRRTDFPDPGNRVSQMYMNYQTIDNGGDGWFRLLTLNTETNETRVNTYSPYLENWSEFDGESFEFNLMEGTRGRGGADVR